MKQTKLTMNLDGLDNLVKQMGGEFVARVGVLGSKNSRSDGGSITNSEIGAIHEFGSITNNIPPRSFLRLPLESKRRELMTAFDTGSVKKAMNSGDYKKVFQILGIVAEGIVQQGFSSSGFGQWPPLNPATIRAKGSSAILIDTAELRKAQTSDVIKRSEL